MIDKMKKYEVRSMNILRSLLKIAKKNRSLFEFLAKLPAPMYICANFHDWIPTFIEFYKKEI